MTARLESDVRTSRVVRTSSGHGVTARGAFPGRGDDEEEMNVTNAVCADGRSQQPIFKKRVQVLIYLIARTCTYQDVYARAYGKAVLARQALIPRRG